MALLADFPADLKCSSASPLQTCLEASLRPNQQDGKHVPHTPGSVSESGFNKVGVKNFDFLNSEISHSEFRFQNNV